MQYLDALMLRNYDGNMSAWISSSVKSLFRFLSFCNGVVDVFLIGMHISHYEYESFATWGITIPPLTVWLDFSLS